MANNKTYTNEFFHDFKRVRNFKEHHKNDLPNKISTKFHQGVNKYLRDKGVSYRLHTINIKDSRSIYGQEKIGLILLNEEQSKELNQGSYFLSDESFDNRFNTKGVEKILQIGINYQSSLDAQKIVKEYDGSIELKYSIGCHPADTIELAEIADIKDLILASTEDSKLVGIGEIGLDYFHKTNTEEQKDIFCQFLDLAAQQKLPVIIHSRDAAEDTYQILESYRGKVSGVIHCFTYDAAFAKKFVDLGFYISLKSIRCNPLFHL